MTAEELRWDRVGMGVSLAAAWFDMGDNRQWVSFMATSEGRGQRRKWSVIATYYDDASKPVRTIAAVREGFRYEAAELALSGLRG